MIASVASPNMIHPIVMNKGLGGDGRFSTSVISRELISLSPTSMLCCTFSLITFCATTSVSEGTKMDSGSNTSSFRENLKVPNPFHFKGLRLILSRSCSPKLISSLRVL